MTEHRIVSLLASATEIVAALGYRDQLVGRSHECDFPPDVLDLPVCTEAKIDVSGTSREIDEAVKQAVTDAMAVYRVFPDVLDRLEPTLIVTQTQCDVCAVSLKDVERAACEMVRSKPAIVALEPHGIGDIYNDIRSVGAALKDGAAAERLIDSLKTRLADLSQQIRERNLPRRSVGSIEWVEPLMAGGNWVPELVELVGAENCFGEARKHSPWMDWDDLLAKDPDVLVILPCGFDIPRTRAEMPALVEDPRWQQLKAVRDGQVYVTDGNQFFNRPGPRIVESAEILAEILYPDEFDFGHQGTAWQPL